MPTARFVKLIGVPERSYRRWQAKARQGRPPKGPWPQPARDAARPLATKHALERPAWGHRKIWAMTRHNGHKVSQATVLRLLRDDRLILASEYQKQRRELAKNRKAAFAKTPTGPNQVWQLDFSQYRDHDRWDVADRRVPGLVLEAGAPVPRVPDGESVRRDRGDRTRAGGLRDHVRAPARRPVRDRRRDR